MVFPDQSPVVLIVLLAGLLALGLLAAARDLLRPHAEPGLTCPKCGQPFDPQRWTRHNERMLYHGRYTVTPLYTCPRCGETVRMASP
jgi:uncharacterized C2H2 Zn-finger protein